MCIRDRGWRVMREKSVWTILPVGSVTSGNMVMRLFLSHRALSLIHISL